MVVCLHLPRFALTVAAGGPQALAGQPVAIAPSPGERCVGEVSGAAQAHGVRQGMALGEALARCPSLGLLPADPVGVADAWEETVAALEGIGARVEASAAGTAFFAANGLLRLHGGLPMVIEAARVAVRAGAGRGGVADGGEPADKACDREGRRVRRGEGIVAGSTGRRARIGVGPGRFCAAAAASMARPRRGAVIVQQREAARWLSAQPVELLRFSDQAAELVLPLHRLGVRTLGALRRLGRDALADRFGSAGVCAYDLAGGWDTPLVPRRIPERLEETMELGEADSGPALERVLRVLIERLLSHPRREGRPLRAVTLSARLVEGGTWRETIAFREATAEVGRMRLALCPRLAQLPAPAQALRLQAESFGLPGGDQQDLLRGAERERARRLAEAVGQARAAAGPDAALRVVLVDPDSRAPERRAMLAPFQR